METIESKSLEFLGEWMKKNDVVEFRHGDMFVKRVEPYPKPEMIKEQNNNFQVPKPELSEDEQLFGVGAIEWQR